MLLTEILSEAFEVGVLSQKVANEYEKLTQSLGPEFQILLQIKAEGIDGVFGKVKHGLTDECTECTLKIDMATVIAATKARNNFFDILNAVIYKGEEFVVEKSGEGSVRIVPEPKRPSLEEIDKILGEFKRVFGKHAKRKYWGVMDTPAWKRKERRYLERLSKGIID